jgi:HEPN domain-containing protein
MTPEQIANEWISFAKRDLESAKFLINMYPRPIEIICYHCQQSAEKYLKAFLILQNQPIRKTHDLVLLNQNCKTFEASFEEIEDDCIELVAYGVQARYPYELEINEQDMNQAVKSADKIEGFIISRIDKK